MHAQVALSKDFLTAYSRLPKTQQKKVRDFTEKFREDPTRTGLNFERIEGAVDPKVRSVRIDQTYRAIVVHPPRGDVFLCVWVDHHDDAYAWAANKRFEIHPRVGEFQIFEEVEPDALRGIEPEEAGTQPAPPLDRKLLEAIDDEDLILAGVPYPLLPAVRALENEAQLDRLAPLIPPEVAESLYRFAAGYSLVEVLEQLERQPPADAASTPDPEDFKEALEKPEAERNFRIVRDDDELQEILDQPLEQWRIFLHPTQRRVVEMQANGPMRVLGGAGTGKTVALMHRARHLAREVFPGVDDRFLVTTFTRNLALELEVNLRHLCGEEIERMEVTNLHSWAIQFMRRHGHTFDIVQSDRQREEWMELALHERAEGDGFAVAFCLEEWDQVVQEQEIRTRDEYLTVPRAGRGVRLGRLQRHRLWKIFERYREILGEKCKVEWPDVLRETRLFLGKQGLRSPYVSVLADEAQDLTPTALRLLAALAPDHHDNLFLAGDGHQRIYGPPVRLSHCGIEVRGRSRRLRLNYRTTEQIRARSIAILEGCTIDDLDGGVDDARGYRSLRQGEKPKVKTFRTEAQEAQSVVDTVRRWLQAGVPAKAICVSARTNVQLRDRYQPLFEEAGVPTVLVLKDPEGEEKQPGVRLATMHRMKGLEFSRVLLVGVQAGKMPLEVRGISPEDSASLENHELQERCLLYVACTRARDELVVLGYGGPSPFLIPE